MSTRPTSGPGPSNSTSLPVRRSTTTPRPRSESVVTSRCVSPCRLSERSSTPEAVTPPPAKGSPPTSRTLTAPSRSTQPLRRAPLVQHGRDDHAPVLRLMVLHQRDQGPPDGHGRAVQGVHVLGL